MVTQNDTPPIVGPAGMLRQAETYYDTPGSENPEGTRVPRNPGQTADIRADIQEEYVAAGIVNWYTNWVRVLPFQIDDLTRDFGDDLYERMMYDPAVVTGVNVYRTGVLADGIKMTPAIRDQGDKDYPEAKKMHAECWSMWHAMETSPDDLLWNLEEAAFLGNKVGEKTWTLDRSIRQDGQLGWRVTRINVKPRISTSYAVDVHKHIIGLLGLVPGIGWPVQVGTILTNPAAQPNLLPRDKFVIRTFRPRDGDPRGTSIVRPAYTAWNIKMQMWAEYVKWLTQFASPSLIGVTPQGAQLTPQLDSLGNPVMVNGAIKLISPQQQMADVLVQLKNSTVATFPFGSLVTPIEMRGQGGPFLAAFKLLNEEITQGISHQALTTQSAQYGTRAQASVHENVQDTIIRQGKKAVVRLVTWEVLRDYVRYNYGENALHLVPHVSLGETEEQDFPATAAGVSALQTSGFLDTSQYPALDETLGLPARSEGWEQRMAEAAAAKAGPGPSDNPQGARNG